MSANLNSTAINSTNTAPYLTSDRTELAPLCSTHQDTKGLRVIVISFTVVTVAVTIALMAQLHHGDYQVTPHGTVVSDDQECSEAGIAVMKRGGSAVDSVIATLFCLSVVLPHLVGIGGGGFLLIYDQRQQEVVGCLDFQAAVGTTHSSIGVPGFVAGLSQAHKSFGRLPWSDLLSAAIDKAGLGFAPSVNLLSAVPLAVGRKDLLDLLTSGHNPQLLNTLQVLAQNGSDGGPTIEKWKLRLQGGMKVISQCPVFFEIPHGAITHQHICGCGGDILKLLYNGSLTEQMTGFVSPEDLSAYRVVSNTCLQSVVGPLNVAVAGPSSGGPLLLQLLLKINQSMAITAPILSVALNLKETMLVSRRYSSGVNVVAVDHNDIYVSAVSGLGSVLGSLDLTTGGYVMNNLNIFSSAHVKQDDRPATLASPIVVTQAKSACGSRFVMGANDVRDAAQLIVELLQSSNNVSLQSVSDAPRARITTTQVLLERNHSTQLDARQLMLLAAWNYTIGNSSEPYPSLNVIHKVGDTVTAAADSRGGGSPASF